MGDGCECLHWTQADFQMHDGRTAGKLMAIAGVSENHLVLLPLSFSFSYPTCLYSIKYVKAHACAYRCCFHPMGICISLLQLGSFPQATSMAVLPCTATSPSLVFVAAQYLRA